LSTLYIVFDVDRSISHDYLVYYFETSLWHQEISKRATEGARNHGLLNIGADSFLDIDILVPENIDEQRCIASFFRSLDTKISLQTKRIEKLKQMKSVCLSKMIA
jgi:type I restriction enzyme S subunit